MRPTVAEQLAGTCRVLEAVVAPEVEGSPAAEVLRGLVKNLRVLETGWSAILPFLHWDIAATSALLGRVCSAVPEPLAARIADELDRAPADPLDVDAVAERDDALRALLSEAVTDLPAGPHRMAVAMHLDERARRYPLRMVPDMPSGGS